MKKEVLLKRLGEQVRRYREINHLTQSELAALINKDRQSIQRLEAGNVNPGLFYLYEIAQGLSVHVRDLADCYKL